MEDFRRPWRLGLGGLTVAAFLFVGSGLASAQTSVSDGDERIRPRQFNATPLMIDGVIYVSTALGQVAARDAGTGEQVWTYDPRIFGCRCSNRRTNA